MCHDKGATSPAMVLICWKAGNFSNCREDFCKKGTVNHCEMGDCDKMYMCSSPSQSELKSPLPVDYFRKIFLQSGRKIFKTFLCSSSWNLSIEGKELLFALQHVVFILNVT